MFGLSRKALIVIAAALIVVIGLIFFIFFRGDSAEDAESDLTPTPAFEEPTPTPEATLDKEDVQIRILNGSGVAGEAGRVQAILEDEGYVIESVGNADEFDNELTDIQAKDSIPQSFLDDLEEALASEYRTTVSELDDDAETDIVIVIGARRNAPTPTPTEAVDEEEEAEETPTPTTEEDSETPTPTPSPA